MNKQIDSQDLEDLIAVNFEDLETVEEIVTGAVSGLVGCCVDIF